MRFVMRVTARITELRQRCADSAIKEVIILISFKRFIGRSLSVLLVAGVIAPVSGNAWMFHSRTQPSVAQAQKAPDTRINVNFHNAGPIFKDVSVAGQTYTVPADGWLQIKAPAGTAVVAESTGSGHRKGDLLFAVTPKVSNSTITLY